VADVAPEYAAARSVLLDALEALGPQREAIVVVGAQAIYLQAGDVGIRGYAPYTTDAELRSRRPASPTSLWSSAC
jgi:hypothetical protein